jgi:hypothetical protein
MVGNLRHINFEPESIALNLTPKFQSPDRFVVSILTKIFPSAKIINSSTCPDGFVEIPQDPPRENREQPVDKEVYFYIREKLLPHISNHKKPLNFLKNIYITRKGATHRDLINEEEFKTFLKTNNFYVLDLESTKGIEQMAIFHNAKNIICVHGAALSNIVFCTPQTRIIELCTPTMSKLLHFSDIAEKCKLDYIRYANLIGSDDYNSHVTFDMNQAQNLKNLINENN